MKKFLIGGIAVLVVLLCAFGAVAVLNPDLLSSEDPANTDDSQEETAAEKNPAENAGELSNESTISDIQETMTNGLNSEESSSIEEEQIEETVPPESNYPELPADSIHIDSYQTDYAHIEDGVIVLGNDEGVTVDISFPAGTTKDEIIVYDEEELLNIEYGDFDSENSSLYVTGKQAGDTQLVITTAYELETKGENYGAHVLNIRKLDSSEGRVAFVTPTGEKYHFSASCAGDSAIRTTYHDCAVYEYEPCGKCAK